MNRRNLFGTGIAIFAAAAANALGKDKDEKRHGKGKGPRIRTVTRDRSIVATKRMMAISVPKITSL